MTISIEVVFLSKRDGQHSIRINDQYRICFYWNNGNVIIEDICDYH
ncbi:MAG: type II toxin-antitoxin system RelE/ParE family toxin [Pseudobutyrivibrio sp.]|nr:type II toxin-antitoxin system RelE/ParE family toxin [Pseudobutyrivibrio sp.]